MNNNRILLIDDDIELCKLLSDYLSSEGFIVDSVHDGVAALEKIRQQNELINSQSGAAQSTEHYALLILDVMMPVKNGFETLADIRKFSLVPVIMLTAKGEKVDRIVGLEMGADDYVAKPCDPRELVARMRAILRRAQASAQSSDTADAMTSEMTINQVKLDIANRQVYLKDSEIECTATEFEILVLLLKQAGKLVSKNQISEQCLGKRLQTFDRSIDMHISNLRKKLDDYAPGKARIKTVRGNGYQYLVWPE